MILRELDVEKLEGRERTYRIGVGDYGVTFLVGKRDRTIYVSHVGKRGSIYGIY